MANVIEVVLLAKNQASPALKEASTDLKAFFADIQQKMGQSARGDIVRWGDAWGTAGGKAKAGAGVARGAIGELDSAAKKAASGGLQELLGQIPVVGNVLGNLATKLSGFPLLLGGIVGVGAGFLAFLKGMNDDATKATAAVTALAEKIGSDFQATLLEVQRLQAQGRQDRVGEIQASAAAELQAIESAKQARIAKAREELNELDMFGRQRTELSKEALAEIAAAEADAANKTVLVHAKKNVDLATLARQRAALEKDLANAAGQAENETLAASLAFEGKRLESLQAGIAKRKGELDKEHADNLKRIEELHGQEASGYGARQDAAREFHAKLEQLARDSAEAQKRIIEETTQAAISITEKLGARFEDIGKRLSVAKFIQDAQAQLTQLNTLEEAIRSGDRTLQQSGVTLKDVTALRRALTEQMQEAITKGYVPVIEKEKELAAETTKTADAAKSAGEKWLDSMEGISAELDRIIEKTRAAGQAAGSVGGGGGVSVAQTGGPITAGGGVTVSGDGNTILTPGLSGIGGTVLGEIINQPKGSGLTPFNPANNPSRPGGSFQHGGVVSVRAHAGEIIDQPQRIVRRLGEAVQQVNRRSGGRALGGEGGGGVTVRFERGAVNYSGGVVTSADRDFATLSEMLAQSIGSRLNSRRR